MDTIRKNLFLSVAGALGVLGAGLLIKYLLHDHKAIKFGVEGKKIDETLHESMKALDNATANIQRIFDDIKGMKSKNGRNYSAS